MRLTWHDIAAPALALAGAGLVLADAAGSPAPGFGGTRVLGATVLLFGVASCAASGGAPGAEQGWQSFVGILGAAAFTLGVITIATASTGALQATAGVVAGMAVLSTARRMLRHGDERGGDPADRSDDRELVGGRR